MSVESHLIELHRKHEALEKQLDDVMQHPASSDEEIAALKREKLKLKDEIAELSAH